MEDRFGLKPPVDANEPREEMLPEPAVRLLQQRTRFNVSVKKACGSLF